MTGTPGNSDRPRGRPRRDQRGDVPDELIRALQDVLSRKPAEEITLREIAARAGTSPEMVRYYFNGKNGLIAALLDESLARVQSRLDRLKEDLAQAKTGHSQLIVACLAALYLDERQSGKLFNSAFMRARNSDQPKERATRAYTIVNVLHDVITELMRQGIYRASLNPARTAILIMSLTGCPVRLLDTLAPRWLNEEDLRDAAWIAEATRMVEACCRA